VSRFHASPAILAALILLAAFALRMVAIDHAPAGLSHDEAANGIAALDVLHGQFRIFYEINKGIEPLIIWLEGLAFYGLGIGPVQLRMVNIFAGLLTVALVYPLSVRLFGRRVALLALAGLAVLFWAVFVSRLTLRAVLLPPLLLLTLYLFWRALFGRRPLLFFALSGVAAGVTMYTYLSSRFVPLILLTLFAYQLLCRKITRRHWLGLLLFGLIWAAIFWPLAAYFVDHADSFSRRADQVSTLPYLLNGDLWPTLRNTARTLGMFNLAGDTTDRYNLNGRPVFDAINGLFFLLGVGLALGRLARAPSRSAPMVLLLSTAFFMLLPDFITDDSPHFLRTIGALPAACIFWALGVDAVAAQLERRFATGFGRGALPALAGLLIGGMALHTGYDYFVRWNSAPEARKIYGADIAAVARYLKNSPSTDLPAISAEYYRDLDRFRFDLYFGGRPPFAIWFDGRQSLAFPPPAANLSPRYIFPASAPAPEPWAALLRPVPEESGPEYKLYRLPADLPARLAQLQPVGVVINNELILTGYQVLQAVVTGRQFEVLLGWQALKALPPGTDYTLQVQMHDGRGQLWLQTDGLGFDPGDWQPGVVGLQLLTFRLPGDLPPLVYQLSARLVNRQTGQPLPASDGRSLIPLGIVTADLAGTPRPVNPDLIPNFSELPEVEPAAGLALRGYHVDQLSPDVKVSLHWQVLRRPAQNYRLQFELLADGDEVAYRWPPVEPLGGEWATSNWPAEYWVQNKLSLPVGPDVPAGEFALRGRWLNPNGQPVGQPFGLGVVQIGP